MSVLFLSNGWQGKGQLVISVLYLHVFFFFFFNLGDALMPESEWLFVPTNQLLHIVPFLPTPSHLHC